jgi:hypothetical protein
MHRSLPLLLALALVPVSAVAGLAAERQAFVILQEAPDLNAVDLDVGGPSHGDLLAFEARITHDDGRAGTLRGILITVDLPEPGGDVHEDRIGQLLFDLGEGDSLVVAGGSVYPHQSVEMAPDNAQVRAVIGGTGAFIGARGQVTTIRDADGTYEHRFELLD